MLTEGMYIADRYEILGKVGAGGMSDVYKAKDLTLGRFVAIKVLKAEFSEDINFVTKFRSEAQAAAGLEHPNIVNIYDVGSENGLHYIVMEYVEGITLKTYIEKKGQLSFKEAVSIAIQVGRGIEAAHNKNIVHRDIKPQNIMISTEGKVKVTDFGIARAATSNTISSDVMGSVHYSSPEQARNGFVDGKSDIYSLGIVMYEMVTGRVPFDGDTTVAVAIQHLQEEMVPPSVYAPNLPISMEKIILKCTQKNPDRRYSSMTALLADLRKALISPNEDFVVMVPLANQDKTRVIGADDLNQIKKQTANVYVDPASIKIQEPVIDDDDDDDDDIDDEDGDINPKMEKAITIMGIAAGVVIIIIIIYLCITLAGGMKSGKNTSSNTETTKTETQTGDSQSTQIKDGVVVPSLTGKTMDQAKQELNGTGLGIRQAGTASSDTVEKGQIISQDPADGKTVEKNTTIEVIISSGAADGSSKNTVDIPNVVGQSETDASAALTAKGFNVTKTTSYSSSVAEGYVISQTPNGDTQGKEGDTITLEISLGSEKITVPDVSTSYKSEEQAREMLSQFNVSTTTKYSDTDAGIVIGQSLAVGTQADPGASITITVSLGPEPAQQITTKTYKLNVSLQLPSDTSNISGADIVLYDDQGNVLQTWYGKTLADFGTGGLLLSKTGILSDSGKIVVTWLDLNGNDLKDQTIDVQFQEE
ncbi:Stk1 family PASTA domain-containing Ser/Thr kinase [Roseburia rectibacter]|jgi:serine/threonine protein kinase/beta-lactam-binding protein with PASTA domain|uniref:Stk1 family PASTA domain-containing Ser/Thr kinase n=1 Tax=Roseburia TaxID=841 RepID=UPI00164B583F|nr:Stk1 family PASTA domain-containing Ser/Thr kinase [Roseburia rectibacter]UMZ01493.1 Stk1 family PASTA domain-containing Ser/Thr kinase [Roseburia rectibacter]